MSVEFGGIFCLSENMLSVCEVAIAFLFHNGEVKELLFPRAFLLVYLCGVDAGIR